MRFKKISDFLQIRKKNSVVLILLHLLKCNCMCKNCDKYVRILKRYNELYRNIFLEFRKISQKTGIESFILLDKENLRLSF